MKWVMIILGAVIVLALIVVVVGLVLPKTHVATSRITIHQSPDTVWTAVRDLGGLPSFWKDITRSDREPDPEGREVWKQTMRNGFGMTLLVVEENRPRRLVTEIVSPPGAAFGGRWIYQLTPMPTGTDVSVTEDGWIANPLFRVVSKVMGYHGTIDSYLGALGTRFGESVRPAHQ